MAEWNSKVNEVFLAAAEVESPAERQVFLDQHCGNDPGLRAQVESLLAASAKVGSFLNKPAAQALPRSPGTVDYEPIAERPGTLIGPYKLMEQIGEGGFGLVFVAEQQQPVRRKVALKIIKPGMDTREVIARFEAERQALALMDHQNIAKVFDAGTTESGRPYFVMELVHGVPITEYCDANKLTPRQRLELFVPVCQAIQHAHQKGIIHRDIKPSNVLVTMYDDKPVPKVIDFGVAKAIEQRLTEKSVYTQFGMLVGTFEYMSPEQAEMNAFGVDTRSDIYALGVLLYELMTGTTPLERAKLREAAFSEIVRRIKEEEPQKPSVRLSTSGTLAKVAAARKTEPAKLSRLMRGELDWVVMRCLEKDRSRRYDTASALSKDVARYLKDEPVEARPPSMGYRLRKAARRHRTALSVAGVVVAVVVLGAAVSLWQASIARAERERAEIAETKRIEEQAAADAALVAERRQYALDRAIEAAFSSDPAKADKAIVEAERVGVAPDRVRWLRGLVYSQQGKVGDAIREFDASNALKPSVAAHAARALALFGAGLETGNPFRRLDRSAWVAVQSMTPQTAEDYLCRGHFTGIEFSLVPQALADLDKAIAMRDTPMARAWRASTLSQAAFDTGDTATIERALEDIRQAKLRLSDIPSVRVHSLTVHLRAANLYRETGQPEKQKAALEEAGRDAKALQNGAGHGFVMSRVCYFEQVGDTKSALDLLDTASRRPETRDVVVPYALRLYQMGRDDDARRVLDERVTPDDMAGQMLRIVLWAEQPEIGRDKAFERYRERVAARLGEADWGKVMQYVAPALMLLGKRKEAADLLPSTLPFAPPRTPYWAGSWTETKLFEDASKSRAYLSMAHYAVGLVRLSEGDRTGARDHLQKTVDINFYSHPTYTYARAYLERLKRDPEWPKWIPVKK
jgi:serine/threonine protein kinase